MVIDKRTSQSSLESSVFELPPSYDFATALPSSQSSAGPSQESSDPTKHISHLFSCPPNVEPLLGRSLAPAQIIAEIESSKRGNGLMSLDPRLADPDVLYDFLRAQALIHPAVKLRCIGVHFETPQLDEVVEDRDGPRQRRKGHPERIVDFDFTIDLSPVLVHPENLANVHLFTLSSDVPALRGTFTQSPSVGSLWSEWESWRMDRGLPVWTAIRGCKDFWETRGKGKIALRDEEADVEGEGLLGSAQEETGLNEWCERYTADPGLLKEFRLCKGIWGWDFSGLTTAVKGAITSTGYTSNQVEVKLDIDDWEVVVRPSNLLSRALSIVGVAKRPR